MEKTLIQIIVGALGMVLKKLGSMEKTLIQIIVGALGMVPKKAGKRGEDVNTNNRWCPWNGPLKSWEAWRRF